MKIGKVAYLASLVAILVLALHFYVQWLPLQKPQTDFFGVFLFDLTSRFSEIWNAFGSGSAFLTIYAVLAGVVLPFLFLFQKFFLSKRGIFLVWTNPWWLVYTEVSIILATLVAIVGQYENWYWDPVHNMSGSFDTVSHFLSSQMIASILANVDFKDIFGLKGRWGRIAEVALVWSMMALIGIYFEWNESLHPERYYSEYWDSVGDLADNFKGVLIATANYNLIVPYEE